jgi:hypothetical protein
MAISNCCALAKSCFWRLGSTSRTTDLVHGTPVEVPLQLPSANLEYYLREAIYVTIEALLQVKHIHSLESVFDRAAFAAGLRKEILARKGGDKSVILEALQTGIVFRLAK